MTKKQILILCICSALVFALLGAGITYFIMRWTHEDDIYIAGERYNRLLEFFEIEDIADIIEDNYYKEIESEEIVGGALEGVLENLGDGYSRFYPEKYFQYFDEKTEGSYLAQGMLVDKDDESGYILVKRVLANTPAFEQNIAAGNLITAIDGMDTRDMDAECAVSCLRGKNGVEITLDILAGDTPVQLKFVRKSTDSQIVFTDMPEAAIGYIDILEFSGSCVSDFKKAVESLEKEGAKTLIIDIRNVPGGYISQACSAADLLLDSGEIYSIKGRDNNNFTISAEKNTLTEMPVVLLMNSETKGAAEVFAAALLDNGRAYGIGSKTYGKGAAMSMLQIPNSGNGIRLVTAYYYTPKGLAIDKMGVLPSESVDPSDNEDSAETDLQYERALEYAEEIS